MIFARPIKFWVWTDPSPLVSDRVYLMPRSFYGRWTSVNRRRATHAAIELRYVLYACGVDIGPSPFHIYGQHHAELTKQVLVALEQYWEPPAEASKGYLL